MLFQSTHSQGVRPDFYRKSNAYYTNFNPRTHKECDMWLFLVNLLVFRISIHALTRSATVSSNHSPPCFNNFNPRTHKECDGRCLGWGGRPKRFQSTHSQGVRPDAGVPYPFAWLFQSTHSQGVRLWRSGSSAMITLFQSTHSQGVRHFGGRRPRYSHDISIHALTRSATSN